MAGREFDGTVARNPAPQPWRRVARGARVAGSALLLSSLFAAAAGGLWLLASHTPAATVSLAVEATGAAPTTLSGAGLLVHGATLAALAGGWCWGLALVLAGLFER